MTLQERLRDPAHGFDRNDSHTEDRYVCLCEHLANEAADALDAKDARIAELEGALRAVIRVKEEKGNDSRMADAISRAREALKDKP